MFDDAAQDNLNCEASQVFQALTSRNIVRQSQAVN